MNHHGVGDPLDAVILGDQLPYGYSGKVKVKGVMRFMDAGVVDDKLICTQLIQGNFLPLFITMSMSFGYLLPKRLQVSSIS